MVRVGFSEEADRVDVAGRVAEGWLKAGCRRSDDIPLRG